MASVNTALDAHTWLNPGDMVRLMNFPSVLAVISFAVLCLMVRLGLRARRKATVDEQARRDLDVVMAASLTLLALIIGFTFSMAITRYDQRKTYEADEANAIGTEFLRADLLPQSDSMQLKSLLRQYTYQRVAFYQHRSVETLTQIQAETNLLSTRLWLAVAQPARIAPSATTALAVSGMNNVLDSAGYTQAAWWNRIPAAAWYLVFLIASCSCFMTGYSLRRVEVDPYILLTLPFLISVSFFLISDIDSPTGGLTRVGARNLLLVLHSMGSK